MGIPSYFSYIIKNYTDIIRNIHACGPFQHLFMDCNSIVYSAYHLISNEKNNDKSETKTTVQNIEKKILKEVVKQIREYIFLVRPTKSIYIAFDGVAPFAKMKQQRIRRYKTDFMSRNSPLLKVCNTVDKVTWNTTAITPGTSFMDLLNKTITKEFQGKTKEYGVENIWISNSNKVGEGEHKLFEKLRTDHEYFKEDQIALYGLDSDLIMLSIFHQKYCAGIQVFRESPEFNTVLDIQKNKQKPKERLKPTEQKELLFMNISELSSAIASEMHLSVQQQQQMVTVYDYIFMCFFLGNDFMPHFPAFNIRTHGIQILTDTYRTVIGNHPDRSFVNITTGKINWKWVHLFIDSLAKQEHGHFVAEMNARDKNNKNNKRQWTSNTPEEQEQILHHLPIIYRGDENYICPTESGWKQRYYRVLFNIEPTEENIRKICINYLEGLEWVLYYYTNKCVDWRWSYKYDYPPLMSDLNRYVLSDGPDIQWMERPAFSENTQLAYVLPCAKLDLCKHSSMLLTKYSHWYPEKYNFQWAFCRYFWEAHPLLPEIPTEELEQLDIMVR